MPRPLPWLEAHQVALFLTAILVGAALGLLAPAVAPVAGAASTPALALLLFATFLGVPIASVARAVRDIRFFATLLVVDFVVAPLVAWALSRAVADDAGLFAGLLLVLLTPCVDYVVVFTGLAGGARERLLAATPLLMVLQLVLLPIFLTLFGAGTLAAEIDPRPFGEAFLFIIVVPLAAAWLVQSLARSGRSGLRRPAEALARTAAVAMVPLMMLVLAVVVASQIAAIGQSAVHLVRLVPLYAAFLVVMVAVGALIARAARLDPRGARAVVFSGATRNSLVVLPLALALPAGFALAPLAVVTQTLVELVGMVVLVRVVPKLVSARADTIRRTRRPPAD